MKKMIIGTAVFVGALAALRRLGPALGERAMRRCHEMFGRTCDARQEPCSST